MPSGSITNRVVFHTRRRYSAATTPAVCWNGREPTTRLTNDIGVAPAASVLAVLIRLRIEQPVQMHDEIAHVGVVDGLLGLRLPGGVGGGVVGIDPDDVHLRQIPELDSAEILELAAEHEMHQLPLWNLVRHCPVPQSGTISYANSASRSRMRSSNTAWRARPAASSAP